MKRWACLAIGTILGLGLVGMIGTAMAAPGSKLKGDIKIDGSSTVFLISKAVAADFRKLHSGVSVNIAFSGTGAGFRKLAAGDVDIQDASRRIKAEEAELCKKNGIEYVELQVAWDGLAVVVHKDNNFATKLTMAQLKKIWHPEQAAKTWKEVDPSYPNEPFSLWGAGKDSGTFDYFTEAVNGKERIIRQDYNGSEDDVITVKGVSGNKFSMGFFGVAYYTSNKGKMNVIAIAKEAGGEYFEPTDENVRTKKYPLSRPLFIYVTKKSLAREEVREFVNFYQANPQLSKDVGYMTLSTLEQAREKKKFASFVK